MRKGVQEVLVISFILMWFGVKPRLRKWELKWRLPVLVDWTVLIKTIKIHKCCEWREVRGFLVGRFDKANGLGLPCTHSAL